MYTTVDSKRSTACNGTSGKSVAKTRKNQCVQLGSVEEGLINICRKQR